MAEQKKILVSLPESFLAEIDACARMELVSRSELVRRALQNYLEMRRRETIRHRMETGYAEMGEINLEIARACFYADTETMLSYEENLG